ncbi:MAG: ATP/GTP-binding protein [Candidatus Jordarchaeaceae archaeon]
MFAVPFLGPAGSGKTSLAGSFGEFLVEKGYEVKIFNLDAGAEYLPYVPDFDIRDFFRVSEIMKKEHIGPNASIIRASEMIYEVSDQIIDRMKNTKADYILIDTPGQLEVFAFKPTGSLFMEKLRDMRICGIFLLGADTSPTAAGFIVALLMSMAIQIQLGISLITVLHKSDILKSKDFLEMLNNPELFKDKITTMEQGGVIKDLALDALKIIKKVHPAVRVIATSIINREGYEELFDLLHEIFCSCGDNL